MHNRKAPFWPMTSSFFATGMVVATLGATLLSGCGGGTGTAKSTVINTAPQAAIAVAATTDTAPCPTCAQGNGDPSLVPTDDDRFTTKTIITVAADPDGGTPKFYDAATKELTSEQVKQVVLSSLKDSKSAVYFKPILLENSGVVRPRAWEYKNQIGCYFFRISWEDDYIGSCIHRSTHHLGFLVRNNCKNPSTMVFDGHACGWNENGPQFGLYNSASGWCKTSRGGFTRVRGVFYAGLIAAGVAAWLAAPIADISAGIAVSALAV